MRRLLVILITYHLSLFASFGQCGIENTAFKSGESLEYDLYFNWHFIWIKVGTASMDTRMTKFEGKDAWKSYLITRGFPKLDKYFVMRDTLLSYCAPDLSPLYFRPGMTLDFVDNAGFEGIEIRNCVSNGLIRIIRPEKRRGRLLFLFFYWRRGLFLLSKHCISSFHLESVYIWFPIFNGCCGLFPTQNALVVAVLNAEF